MEPEPPELIHTLFFSVPETLLFSGWGPEHIVSGLLILILLCCSALVSGSEVAYFSLNHNDIEDLEKENGNSPASQRVTQLLQQPAYLLATILIANNFINIGIIILGLIAFEPLEFLTQSMEAGWQKDVLNFSLTTILITFFLVLFGEVSPKIYAKLYSMKLAKLMSGTMLFLRKIFYPISSILVKSSSFLEKRLSSRSQGNKVSASEIGQAIELTVSREIGSEREVDILKSIIQFNNIAVKQIMRSRVDVKAIDFQAEFKEILRSVKKWGYSRVPVFDEDFDNITGILHVKDLLRHLNEDGNFEWQGMIRSQVMYVPESKKINELLNEFQEKRTHMAIVVDEYGGSSGIVTLEDVMEEVIGEIKDEFDAAREIDFQKINTHTYIFEGKTMLYDIYKLLDIEIDKFDEIRGEADSLAGMLVEVFGFIPQKGKTFAYNDYKFEVIASNNKRIERIKLILPKKS